MVHILNNVGSLLKLDVLKEHGQWLELVGGENPAFLRKNGNFLP